MAWTLRADNAWIGLVYGQSPNTGYGYQIKWGQWEFKSYDIPRKTNYSDPVYQNYIHSVYVKDLKISSQVPQSSDTTTEGNNETKAKGPKPIEVSFSINYIGFLTNHTIHSMVNFWNRKRGQAYPLLFGGSNPVVLTYYPMKLISIDTTPIIHGGGTWAAAQLDFKFEEVLPENVKNDEAPHSCIYLGA